MTTPTVGPVTDELTADFYHFESLLPDDERKILLKARALMRDEVGMGDADHVVQCLGTAGEDRRHRPDHRLDALARGQQAEGHDRLAVNDAQPLPRQLGRLERAIGHAMLDHRDLARRHLIDALEQRARMIGHDHQ